MKQVIRLTESDLHRIIKESVKQALNEGHWKSEINEKWNKALEIMGAEQMIDALYTFLDGDTIEEFIEQLERVYELPLSDNEDEEDDDEF